MIRRIATATGASIPIAIPLEPRPTSRDEPATSVAMQDNEPTTPADDSDEDFTPAFLFESRNGAWLGVSLDEAGSNLPAAEQDRWTLKTGFRLGVHEPVPAAIDPEPTLRGLKAHGYFVWPAQRTLPFGTAQ